MNNVLIIMCNINNISKYVVIILVILLILILMCNINSNS